jgi:hypothetical protein
MILLVVVGYLSPSDLSAESMPPFLHFAPPIWHSDFGDSIWREVVLPINEDLEGSGELNLALRSS